MNRQLRTQISEIRRQSAELLERAERLLAELREITDITTPATNQEKKINDGRIVLHIR